MRDWGLYACYRMRNWSQPLAMRFAAPAAVGKKEGTLECPAVQPICTLLHRRVNLHFQFSITAPDTKKAPLSRCFQLVEKAIFDFYASCGSTHSIEFALQIHKFREHGPGHPLLPLCGNSPCVSRNLYKGRKNVPVGRGFSSRFARKRGFEREAVRKTKFFDSLKAPLSRCFSHFFRRTYP